MIAWAAVLRRRRCFPDRRGPFVFVFDHDGITTTVPQPGENWFEQSGVWVTNPHEHPEHIE